MDEAIHTTVDEETKRAIRLEAARRGTSMAAVIRSALADRFDEADE